jgi:alkanesulfonate monooxygenase SsuD/methylene tetrahydromethanopterin reductase-like flavin-dependent oxidoreductase (luciferase family)
MIGAKGPRMLEVAARHADIWSWFAEARSDMAELRPHLDAVVAACEAIGRDPATIGRSGGVVVEPTSRSGSEQRGFGVPIRGSSEEIADALRGFKSGGCTQVEVIVWPPTPAALDAMVPVLELLDAG